MKKVLISAFLVFFVFVSGIASSPVQVMLDFFPNPNHVPLIVAIERGYFQDEGLNVEIVVPQNPSDPVKLVAAGAVDVALTPQINLLIACDAGLPVIAVGSLINSPLGGLMGLAERGIDSLSDLRGGKIGYSLSPLEPILWRTMLTSVGIHRDEYELINVGFNTVLALLSGQVDAIGAFRNFEVLQVTNAGKEPSFFPQEAYGVPHTEEVLIVVSTSSLADDPRLEGFLCALKRGITFTKTHSEDAFSDFIKAYPDLDDNLNRQAYEATIPLYSPWASMGQEEEWHTLADYLYDNDLIESRLSIEEVFTDKYLREE